MLIWRATFFLSDGPYWQNKHSFCCYKSIRSKRFFRHVGIAHAAHPWMTGIMETNLMVDRVQITRLDGSQPRWQIGELKVYTSQLRYALRASEAQIREAVEMKPGQQMFVDLYLSGQFLQPAE